MVPHSPLVAPAETNDRLATSWCRRRDSNPHVLSGPPGLSRLRLPFRHSGPDFGRQAALWAGRASSTADDRHAQCLQAPRSHLRRQQPLGGRGVRRPPVKSVPANGKNHGFGRTLGGGGWFIHRPTLPWACPAGYQSQVVTTNTIRHSCVRMRWSTSIPTWDDRHSGACASSK